MEKVFNPSSWDFKPTSLKIDNKNINLINPQQQNSVNIKQIEMVFLNQLHFDNEVRIDIEIEGDITLKLNNYSMKINSTTTDNHCIIVNNHSLKYNNLKTNIESSDDNSLNLFFNTNTNVKKFTIIQNIQIDSCNPLN
jgi:hypothetical protein